MALVTLRVIDGADRGRIFSEVPTPLTIGREEGNPVQLNDERISRFHLKIQAEDDHLVLTDLESTNGTRVNGETVQIWNLRAGDVIAMGRSMLVFGSREEIAERLAELRRRKLDEGVALEVELVGDVGEMVEPVESVSLESELAFGDDPDAQALLHTLMPPDLPRGLTPGQAAQLSELLHYLHVRLRGLLQAVKPRDAASNRVTLELREWQNLVDLQDRIAHYLRRVGEPGD